MTSPTPFLRTARSFAFAVVSLVVFGSATSEAKIIKNLDSDGDGIPNYKDNNIDGLPGENITGVFTRDNLLNWQDSDMDGDQLANDAATENDIDGDGADDDDPADKDIDCDFKKNNAKAEKDIDGDFKADNAVDETDIDGDGQLDTVDNDMDADDLRNTKDRNMDGDDVVNGRNGELDTDSDGLIDSADTDDDGDGILDPKDRDDDSDGDPDYRDTTYQLDDTNRGGNGASPPVDPDTSTPTTTFPSSASFRSFSASGGR